VPFESEADFEAYIRKRIQEQVTAYHPEIYAMENKKAVDILICKDGPSPSLFFLEIKFHRDKHGRLGFGSGKGLGFQPEILLRRPTFFERNLRWVVGSEAHEPGKILFLSNSQILEFVAGGGVGPKFNNIQKRIFREGPWLNEDEFVLTLQDWLLEGQNND